MVSLGVPGWRTFRWVGRSRSARQAEIAPEQVICGFSELGGFGLHFIWLTAITAELTSMVRTIEFLTSANTEIEDGPRHPTNCDRQGDARDVDSHSSVAVQLVQVSQVAHVKDEQTGSQLCSGAEG